LYRVSVEIDVEDFQNGRKEFSNRRVRPIHPESHAHAHR
jgi:hypothetical protein